MEFRSFGVGASVLAVAAGAVVVAETYVVFAVVFGFAAAVGCVVSVLLIASDGNVVCKHLYVKSVFVQMAPLLSFV